MTASYLGLPQRAWQAVSLLTSFPVITIGTALFITLQAGGELWPGVATYTVFFILFPGIVAAYFWRKGWVSDIEVHDRQERNSIFLAALGFGIIGAGILQHQHVPAPLFKLALTQLLLLGIVYTVNLAWKISVHTSSWGAMLTVLYLTAGAPALLLLPLAVPMTLSRFALNAHTRRQVAAGFSAGMLAAAVIFLA